MKEKLERAFEITIVLLCLLVIVTCVLTIAGCESEHVGIDVAIDAGAASVEFLYIQGMPCYWVTRGSNKWATSGLTCDWSQWNGRTGVE